MNTHLNWRAVRAIATRDLKIVVRSKGVILPLILVPTILMILLPGISALVRSL